MLQTEANNGAAAPATVHHKIPGEVLCDLRHVLALLDAGAELREGGYSSADAVYKAARAHLRKLVTRAMESAS